MSESIEIQELSGTHLSYGTTILKDIVDIHRKVFPTDSLDEKQSESWIKSKKSALEEGIGNYFVAVENKKTVGYIFWTRIGGIRDIIELEQIGVNPEYHGQGIGTRLIDESIEKMELYVREKGFDGIQKVRVTTGTENEAQRLYVKTLGAKLNTTEYELYDGDEAIMHATREQINSAREKRDLQTLNKLIEKN